MRLRVVSCGYFRLKSFTGNSCFSESVFFYPMVLVSFPKKKTILENTVRVCSKIAGTSLNASSFLYRARATRKAQTVLANCNHPLFAANKLLPSGCRYGGNKVCQC